MGRDTSCLLSLVAVMAAAISGLLACSPSRDWEPQGATERIETAAIAVFGSVTAHYLSVEANGEIVWPVDEVYTAEMELYCTFKGGPLPDTINISHVGFSTPCSKTQLPVGERYIVLLQRYDGRLELDEVNLETAAFLPTATNFYSVSVDVAVNATEEACINYTGDEAIPCFQRSERAHCTGAGSVMSSSLCYLCLVLLLLLPRTFVRLLQPDCL